MKRKQRNILIVVVIVLVIAFAVAYLVLREEQPGKPLEGLHGIIQAGEENYTFPDSEGRTITIRAKYTPFFDPYERGRTNWQNFIDGESKGVYIIRDKRTGVISYVGQSTSNLYKTLYRHFQSWIDPRQYRTTYKKHGHEVAIFIVKNAREVLELERYLILKYLPRDNEIKYKAYQEQERDHLHTDEEPRTEEYIPTAYTVDPF